MRKVAPVLVLAVLLAARPAAAACPTESADTEALLTREAKRAKRWDLGWAGFFGVAALAQGGMGLAEWVPFRPFDDAARAGVWVGAGKAAIASVSHLVLRLKIPRCNLAEARKHERTTFFLNHAGSLVLNVGGLLLLGLQYDTWKEGWMSIALGYPIGLLSIYTQPRRAWHATVVRSGDYTGLAVAGSW